MVFLQIFDRKIRIPGQFKNILKHLKKEEIYNTKKKKNDIVKIIYELLDEYKSKCLSILINLTLYLSLKKYLY